MVIGCRTQILLNPTMTVRPDLFDLFNAIYTGLSGWGSNSGLATTAGHRAGSCMSVTVPGLYRSESGDKSGQYPLNKGTDHFGIQSVTIASERFRVRYPELLSCRFSA